eukprot:scaffold50118_cov41-Cyclotella_meneghiniana.AAC.3
MPGNDVLVLWRLLTASSVDKAACQSLLLSIPEASSFSFEADPTATSADLEAYQQGSSMLLAVTSPAAKAMGKNIHVGLVVVSKDSSCCGVFNGKEVSMRVDPVVRMCGLAPSGQKGGCTNTSHISCKLNFEGERLLIQTPAVSKATTRAFFSQPYLVVKDLPKGVNLPVLLDLRAPPNIWRAFISGTHAIYKDSAAKPKPGLKVSTEVEDVDSFDEASVKEESPMSFEVVAGSAKPGMTPAKLKAAGDLALKSDPDSLADDALARNVDSDLLGLSLPGMYEKIGFQMSQQDDVYDAAASVLGKEQDDLDDLLMDVQNDEDEDDGSELSHNSGIYSSVPSMVPPRGPPAGSDVSSAAPPSLKSPSGDDPRFLLQSFATLQNNMENRLRTLELENRELRRRCTKAKDLAIQAVRTSVSAQTDMKSSKTALKKHIFLVKEQTMRAVEERGFPEGAKLVAQYSALTNWKATMDERIGSLEMDMRNEDGLVLSLNRETQSKVAAGDASSFTAAGYTLQNEEGVLSMIQPLPSKNNYGVFLNMKILFSLCADDITSLSENLLLHKATKGANFEDTYIARVNTAAVVTFPAAFGRKTSNGDASKTVWNDGFKSYPAFTGGMKYGGKTLTERKLRKVVEMCRSQIARRLPPRQFPMQNAVASAMLDTSALSSFDLLDAMTKFHYMMTSTGLSPVAAWVATQDFTLRVFEELEFVSGDAGEEDMDAGLIWASMQITNKVLEFQRYRWGEHPCICSMLMFSVLERLGEERVVPEDAAAAEALEQCRVNHVAIEELLEKQRADHEKAADALNQVKQLKKEAAARKKDKETPAK